MTIIEDPATTAFIDGDSIDDTHIHPGLSDLQNALDALDEADPAYREAEEFYEGRVPEVFASIRLRRALAATGDPYKLNFAKKPVDAVTERLTIASVTVPDNAPANTALQELWRVNRLQITHKNMIRRAGEYGDAYVVVWPRTDDNGDVTGLDIFYNAPHGCRVFYDAENPLVKAFAVKRWQTDDRVRVNLYYPDRIEKYITKPGRTTRVDASEYMEFYDDQGDEWPYPNPFGEVPIFHLRNDDPYGLPEHAGMYGVQQILHKLILGHMSTVDYTSLPQRYAIMEADASTDEAADDEDRFAFPVDEGGAGADAQAAQLSADPGSVWLLRGMKSVGQFDVANPAGFLDPLVLYLRLGAQISDTPVNRLDPTGRAESGDSKRIAEEPFQAKIADRKTRYQETIREFFTFALKILGHVDVDVVVTWAPTQTSDDKDAWAIIQAKIDAGMPAPQAFLEAGYTGDQVEAWFPHDEDSNLPARVDLLLKLGQALSALGAASGFQLIPTEVITGLIDALLSRLDETAIAEGDLPPGTPQLEPAATPPVTPGAVDDNTPAPATK